MESCTNCGTEMSVDHVCHDCGLVSDVPEMALRPPTAKDFDEPNRGASRVRADRSAPTNLAIHDYGLGSRFDGSSVAGDVEKRELFARMETLNETEPDEADRSLRVAMCSIDALGELLNLPDHVERRVAYLYRRAKREGLTPRRDLRAVLGALITVASREAGAPLAREAVLEGVNELSSMHPHLGKDYNRGGRNVSSSELWEVEQDVREAFELEFTAVKPEQYVPRFAAELGLDREDMALAARICRFVDTGELSRDPKLAAAAVLYKVAKEETKREYVLKKLPIGYTARLSTMANKVVNLIVDQVYDPDAEIETSESSGCLERRMRDAEARYDLERVGEAKEILRELLKKQGKEHTYCPPADGLGELVATDLLMEKDRESPDNIMYG